MKAAIIAVPTIVLVLGGLYFASYLVSALLGLPPSLGFPMPVRAIGAGLVLAGLAVAGWIFMYRSPAAMLVSTYFTFEKLFGRAPVAERLGRTEPLIIVGPQKYTRNPLYFGVILIAFGWGLVGALTFALLAAVFILLWFRLVLIPFEERELRTLFGERYREYSNKVPMLFPFTKRKR